MRSAVEAVLADRARAYVVAGDRVAELAAERGRLLVEDRLAAGTGASVRGTTPDATTRRFQTRWRSTVAVAWPKPSGATRSAEPARC